MFCFYNKIPQAYRQEFRQKEIFLLKNRVRLFCFLAVVIYFLATTISYLLDPSEFKIQEIPSWVLLIAGVLITLYLNIRPRSLVAAKINSYVLISLLLLFLTNICIIYNKNIDQAASIYVFVLFFVAFTIPWRPVEIIPISIMHALAYSLAWWYVMVAIPAYRRPLIHSLMYAEGLIFIAMGFILCLVIRMKEAARDVDNFILLKEVEKKNSQMQKELALATRVHQTLLPKSVSTDLVDVAVTYQPVYFIGGDYAKFRFIDDNKLIFIICDVTGHGVSAALLVNRLHTEFERLAAENKAPGALLNELNDFIRREFAGLNMYLSAFCSMLDFARMEISYSNHGHPAQYLYHVSNSEISQLKSQASLLGLFDEDESASQLASGFSKGDQLLLFTDGVIETRCPDGNEFGKDRIEAFIRANSGIDTDMFNRKLMKELAHFRKKNSFEDDIFIVNIKIKGGR